MDMPIESSSQELPLLSHATSDVFPEGSRPSDHKTPSFWSWDYFFKPLSVYSKNLRADPYLRFHRVEETVPLFLNILLGLQHAGVAYGNVIVPSILLGWAYPANFGKYATASAFIISGLGSLLQCMQIKVPGTPYQIGTGLSAFVGNSLVFGTMTVTLIQRLAIDDGVSVDEAYGKTLGTSAVCCLVFVALSLAPRKYVRAMFPPVVSGVIIILVGLDCSVRGYKYWGGGPDCSDFPMDCHLNGNVVLPYGSPEYLGFGLLVIVLLVLTELFGTPFLRQNRVAFCVGIPFALAAIVTRDGKHYVSGDFLDDANPVDFLWTTTFKLGFDKDLVLPLIGAYLVIYLQAVAVLTGTLEESRLDIEGQDADRRIQGGLITTGIGSLFSVLATGLPVVPMPENNSFVYMSGVASRIPGVFGSLFIFAMGVFGHFVSLETEVPMAIKGGIVVPLAMIIILCGIRILSREKLNQRTSSIIVYSLTFGLGSLVVHEFINSDIWPLDADASDMLRCVQFAVVSMMQVPYFLGGLAAITLHLILPKEMAIGEVDSLPESDKDEINY